MKDIKPIILTDKEKDKEYTLEFDLKTVKYAEANGFKLDDVVNKPMTGVEDLFFYSFQFHHRREVTKDYTNGILERIRPYPEGFIERLVELYAVPFEGDGEEDPFVSIQM